jgi:Clp amino terminal domain, pathogenicity island component
VFERFTDRARRVVVLAQEEARLLNHNYIGTEHVLLGLVHEREGVAARALVGLGISLEAVRQQVEEIVGQGQSAPTGHIPFTPRAKKVLELSLREALNLNHNYIGTEHVLLGLVREGEGVAAQVLVKLGADLSRVRQEVVKLLEGQAEGATEPVGLEVLRERGARAALLVGGPPSAAGRQPAEPVRVVPLVLEAASGDGWRLVLLSLEVWSGWADLRCVVLPTGEDPLPQVAFRCQLADDRGTEYQQGEVAASGDPALHLYQLRFRPPPPEQASTLRVAVSVAGAEEPATVEVALPSEAA